MFDQVFDDFEVSVEASCSQGGRVCLCGWVDICPALHQQSDNFQVTCCSNCIRQAIWQCSRSPVHCSVTIIRISTTITITRRSYLQQQHTRVVVLPQWFPRQRWRCQPAPQIFMFTTRSKKNQKSKTCSTEAQHLSTRYSTTSWWPFLQETASQAYVLKWGVILKTMCFFMSDIAGFDLVWPAW